MSIGKFPGSMPRSAYNYARELVSEDTGRSFVGTKSVAVQDAKEECDINTIVRRFGITGSIPQGYRVPMYGDFPEMFDFRAAQESLITARKSFMELPAELRRRFGNDPLEFVSFCLNKENLPELRKLGLAPDEKKPEPEKVMKVEVINPAPPSKP